LLPQRLQVAQRHFTHGAFYTLAITTSTMKASVSDPLTLKNAGGTATATGYNFLFRQSFQLTEYK
jgi:hypothetical protein